MIFLFILMLTVGCGSMEVTSMYNDTVDALTVDTVEYKNTRTVFRQYIDQFEAEFDVEVPADIRFSFVDEPHESFAGVCSFDAWGQRSIKINKVDWFIEGDIAFGDYTPMREQLMFHELAHCVLNLDHVNEPGHLMQPSVDWNYIVHREDFLNSIR